MSNYLTAVAIITFANMLPAFAPPTWSLLVFFTLRHQLNQVALVLAGVASAQKESSLSKLITRKIMSTSAIAIKVLFILGLVALGNVKWNGTR